MLCPLFPSRDHLRTHRLQLENPARHLHRLELQLFRNTGQLHLPERKLPALQMQPDPRGANLIRRGCNFIRTSGNLIRTRCNFIRTRFNFIHTAGNLTRTRFNCIRTGCNLIPTGCNFRRAQAT